MIYAGFLYAISFASIINSLLYIFQKKDLKRLILGLTLLFDGIGTLVAGMFFSKQYPDLINVFVSYGIWESLTLVACFLLYNITFNQDLRWHKTIFLIFAFPAVEIFLYIWFLVTEDIQKIIGIQKQYSNGVFQLYPDDISYYLNFILNSFYFIYLLANTLFVIRLKKVEDKNRIGVYSALLIFLYFNLFAFVARTIYMIDVKISDQPNGLQWVVFGGMLYMFFLFYQFWPYYYNDRTRFFDLKTFGFEKHTASYLNDLDINQLKERVTELRKEQFYIEEDINLKNMADMTGVTTHQLSEYLNQFENKTFFNFINYLRVEDAKAMLKEDSGKNIIEICYALGYNNPSPFYRAFKNETGLSPRDWVKKNT
ncbi:MAG: helix-turn-helix domain-containing protein [Spirochaetia bacterium]|nr:helix-turn-helix domain-containing protein [Spirochaetia bacterium]